MTLRKKKIIKDEFCLALSTDIPQSIKDSDVKSEGMRILGEENMSKILYLKEKTAFLTKALNLKAIR